METVDKKTQKRKRMLMGVTMFHLPAIPEVKLNISEVRDYKWVPLKLFFDGDFNNFKTKDLPQSYMESYRLPKCIKAAKFPCFEIKMDTELWGITLICMIYFIEEVMKL